MYIHMYKYSYVHIRTYTCLYIYKHRVEKVFGGRENKKIVFNTTTKPIRLCNSFWMTFMAKQLTAFTVLPKSGRNSHSWDSEFGFLLLCCEWRDSVTKLWSKNYKKRMATHLRAAWDQTPETLLYRNRLPVQRVQDVFCTKMASFASCFSFIWILTRYST